MMARAGCTRFLLIVLAACGSGFLFSSASQGAEAKPKVDASVAPLGERAVGEVGVNQQLSFKEEKAAAEMRELEDRMFRLAETLKTQEPENSSRLRMSLKYAKEELILPQMAEIKKALEGIDIASASGEQKELLQKLHRLEEILLSADFDLQAKLERLRQMREIARRLDTAIKEEAREEKNSDKAKEQAKQVEKLKKEMVTLDKLIVRQTEHVNDTKKLTEAEQPSASAAKEFATQQAATQTDTAAMAKSAESAEGEKPPIATAASQMEQGAESLQKNAPSEALPQQQAALDNLQKQKDAQAAQLKALAEALSQKKFSELKKDQAGNQQATNAISDMCSNLGESGAAAGSNCNSASTSMGSASNKLGKMDPSGAQPDQQSAIESLKSAKEDINGEIAKLLNELRSQIKKRVLEELTIMLEKQISVRESTSLLAPRVTAGSRQALASVVALGKSEGKIIDMADDLIGLVEETEFAIALPAVLGAVRDEMADVKEQLAAGDSSEGVIAAEKQIEADLQALFDAMKQMPGKDGNKKGSKSNPADRERELNKIVAELKMIRILQVRLNGDTIKVDRTRAEEPGVEPPSPVVKEVKVLKGRQDDVHEVTSRLNDERGDEIPSGDEAP
jgi:hypothetical protein